MLSRKEDYRFREEKRSLENLVSKVAKKIYEESDNEEKFSEESLKIINRIPNKKKRRLSTESLDITSFIRYANRNNAEEFSKLKKEKSYKCPICKTVKYSSSQLLYNHVIKMHSDEIPDEMPVEQYIFNIRNKKTCGKCVICGKPTEWNPKTNKYHRICSEECKNKYIQEARQRLLKTHGTDDLSKDPEHQKKMLDSRKISKPYKFSDGKEIIANSSYEYDFLKYMDTVQGYSSTDIQPCDIIFEYEFENKKHFYIPDFYMPDFNLIIEVKDMGSKASFIPRMREMDLAKYKKVIEMHKYNFITVVGKDYSKLIEVLDYLKNKDFNTDQTKRLIIEIDKRNYQNINVPKQYRIEQAARAYEHLSKEHYKLNLDINKRLKYLETLEMYSTEGFKENIQKIWNFLKETFKKLIELFQTLINKIISKIYEFTLYFKNKDSLYHQFKSQIFTSIDLKIYERRLNPNLVKDIDEFIEMVNGWSDSFQTEIETGILSENFDEKFQLYDENYEYEDLEKQTKAYYNTSKALFGNKYKDEMNDIIKNDFKNLKNMIFKFFYLDNAKDEISIKEYFGCNIGETPKQIFILSTYFIDRLKRFKNNTELFLKKIKSQKDTIFNFENIDQKSIEKIKNIINKLHYFHNINYLFFIESVKVRGKIAKYLLKGSLGKIFDQITGENQNDPNSFIEKNITFTQYRNPPFSSGETVFFNDMRGESKITVNDPYVNIFHYQYDGGTNFDVFCSDESKNIRKKLAEYIFNIKNGKSNNSIQTNIHNLFQLLQIPIEKSYFTLVFEKDEYLNFKENDKILKFNIHYSIFNYKLGIDDRLYHASSLMNNIEKNINSTNKATNTPAFYSEPRIYFGLNQIMSKSTVTPTIDWISFLRNLAFTRKIGTFGGRIDARNIQIFVVKTPLINMVVYADPEQFLTMNLNDELLQTPNMNDKYYTIHRKNSNRKTQGVFLPNMNNIEVENITYLLRSMKEIIL